MTVFKPNACLREYKPAAVFTIKWLRQAMAMCKCALYVSQVFSAELKLALPFFFFFFFGTPNFFSLQTIFSLCSQFQYHGNLHFLDNSHAWFSVFPLCAHSCLLKWTPYSLQTNPPATLSSDTFILCLLCVHTLAWSEVFLLCCTVCLEQSPFPN